jgi:hypothetical protein
MTAVCRAMAVAVVSVRVARRPGGGYLTPVVLILKCARTRRPESKLPIVVVDSGLVLRTPRNDGEIVRRQWPVALITVAGYLSLLLISVSCAD